MPAAAVTPDFFKQTHDLLDSLKAGYIIKAVVFQNSLDFFQRMVTDGVDDRTVVHVLSGKTRKNFITQLQLFHPQYAHSNVNTVQNQ